MLTYFEHLHDYLLMFEEI